jgi:Ca2+-binding RTX toxin-like protein
MPNITTFEGLPTNWAEAIIDLLANGTFAATGTGLSQAVLVSGGYSATIDGAGLNVTGPRAIDGGTYSSVTLRQDGDVIAILNDFNYPIAEIQGALADPPDDVSTLFGDAAVVFTGSDGQDVAVTGNGNDTISGGKERDIVVSNGGDDTIYADDNERWWGDYIRPGAGNNTIIATPVNNPDGYKDGHDLSFVDFTGGPIKVNLATGVATGTGMHTTFTYVHYIEGTSGDDRLTGGSSFSNSEKFTGSAGDDKINGKGGWDELLYNFEVSDGYKSAAGAWVHGSKGVKVDLAAGTARDAFGDHDTLSGIEEVRGTKFKDSITGDSKANVLGGLEKADTLTGGDGKDTLVGGEGKDKLDGGAKADTFVFDVELKPGNADKIVHFETGSDKIGLSGDIFGKVGSGLSAKEFYAAAGADEAHDRNDRIIYDTSSGKLYYDADGSKTGADAKLFATLSDKPVSLDHGDFIVV